MLNNYICTLDIGSSKIAACVAQFKKNRLLNIYFESLPVKGMREGAVVDSIGLIGSVTKTLKNLKSAWVKNQQIKLDNEGKITEYRVQLKVTFIIDD